MMKTKLDIAKDWLPRYTGMGAEDYGDYVLLTNFHGYFESFVENFDCISSRQQTPMEAATSPSGITMVNFGMGSPNAATIMDLLVARQPKGVLLLGKCGGLKHHSELGHFVLPIAAIRGEGTSDDYMLPEVPALPSFKLHKFVSDKLVERGLEYRTGVVYSTNRRVWEWDNEFKAYLNEVTALGIDMETATIFVVGHANSIARGALLMVSDLPMTPHGVKTQKSDVHVNKKFAELHLEVGIQSLEEIEQKGEEIKHFNY